MKKGFTLIELLGVLIILAIIALITIPIVDNSIKNSRESAYDRTIENILSAARNYATTNNLGYVTTKKPLYISELQNTGFLALNIKNPIDESAMTGCVWYYWDFEHNQYIFEYDENCELEETNPAINISYNTSLINGNGWAKENIVVTLSGNGEIKYCINSEECEPTTVVNGNNTQFITNEGTNYLCALSSNSLGTTDKKCIMVKLDKTLPNIEGVGDLTVNLNEIVDLSSGVNYNDALSGIDGELTITPSTVDTSTIGTKQVTYSISDMAGNTREVVRNIIVDAEAPNIVFNLVDSSVINSNGWANKDFYVRATITDNSGTGIKNANSCTTNGSGECDANVSFSGTTKDFYISTEGNNRACVEVTDNNNKTTKVCSDTYKLDKTAPTAGTANFVGTIGSNDWYTSDVTVNKVNGSDSLSGHSSTTSNISSITSNTTGTTVTITTTDLAGNTASRDYTIKVDKNAPTLTAKSGTFEITEGDSNVVSNYFNVSYSTSGGSISCIPTNTSTLSLGSQTVSCTATGGNGLAITNSISITVNSDSPVLVSGSEFYDKLTQANFTRGLDSLIVFSTQQAPSSTELIDVSANQDNSIVLWQASDYEFYISTQDDTKKIMLNEDSSNMFDFSGATIDFNGLDILDFGYVKNLDGFMKNGRINSSDGTTLNMQGINLEGAFGEIFSDCVINSAVDLSNLKINSGSGEIFVATTLNGDVTLNDIEIDSNSNVLFVRSIFNGNMYAKNWNVSSTKIKELFNENNAVQSIIYVSYSQISIWEEALDGLNITFIAE